MSQRRRRPPPPSSRPQGRLDGFARRVVRGAAPYLLILPALAVIVAVLGYPLYKLSALSFQQYGLAELISGKGTWIGLENYATILGDRQFWVVLLRTVAFTAVTVGLTMVLGTLIALLLARLGAVHAAADHDGARARVGDAAGRRGEHLELDGRLRVRRPQLDAPEPRASSDFDHHDWFVNPWEGFAVITAIVVWGAIPFVTITIFAGLTQVSRELVEAASIDGAGGFRIFRDITLPILKPIFVILASLSVIWNFQVFSQIWIIRNARPEDDYFLMSIYSFVESFKQSEYGLGSAIAVVTVLAMLGVTFVYIRQMVRIGEIDERRRDPRSAEAAAPAPSAAPAAVGLNLPACSSSWSWRSRSTGWSRRAFKQGGDVLSYEPRWFPRDPRSPASATRSSAPYFWDGVRNSLIVVRRGRVLSVVLAFLAALALAKFRFYGRGGFVVIIFAVQMVPLTALIIPLYIRSAKVGQVDKLSGLIVAYVALVLPFCVWTLRGFIAGIPQELEEAAMVDGSTRFGAFVRILLPLVGPGLVATSIFAFIQAWNEYIIAYVMLSSPGEARRSRSGSRTSPPARSGASTGAR